MSFRADKITIFENKVICDSCRKEKLLRTTKDAPINFDQRMNGALANGFTFTDVGGKFINLCEECK